MKTEENEEAPLLGPTIILDLGTPSTSSITTLASGPSPLSDSKLCRVECSPFPTSEVSRSLSIINSIFVRQNQLPIDTLPCAVLQPQRQSLDDTHCSISYIAKVRLSTFFVNLYVLHWYRCARGSCAHVLVTDDLNLMRWQYLQTQNWVYTPLSLFCTNLRYKLGYSEA